jgi:hypothetical protein
MDLGITSGTPHTDICVVGRDEILLKLRPERMPAYDQPVCFPGTCSAVIEFIEKWIDGPRQGQRTVLWLFGLSGSGKSTISATIAEKMRARKRLGGFMFFKRGVKGSRPEPVIRTLAYMLGSFDPRIGDPVSAAIENLPTIAEAPPEYQFQHLITLPLSVAKLPSQNPIVIVIDALDECGTLKGRKRLLKVLKEEISLLPPTIRILVTSRRERDIDQIFRNHRTVLAYELDTTSASMSRDIFKFFTRRFWEIREEHAKEYVLPPDWPGPDKLAALTTRAGGLFIWASTACAFVEEDPIRRLDQLIAIATSPMPFELVDMYKTALQSACDGKNKAFKSDCLAILGLILVAKIGLSFKAIDSLFDLSSPSLHIISHLGSILRWSENGPISILHPSFGDFLSPPNGASITDGWFVDLSQHHLHLAERCIKLLEKKLGQKKSSQPLTKHDIPEDVSYACVYWIEHICCSSVGDAITDKIYRCLSRHLLHWMEAMSVLKMSRKVIGDLQQLQAFTLVCNAVTS